MGKKEIRETTYIEVILTKEEIRGAEKIGKLRYLESKRMNLKDSYGAEKEDGLRIHVLGALGEQAFAKAIGADWDHSVNTFRSRPDVNGFEVRTRSKHNYDLIIRDNDGDERKYVLVTSEDGILFIVRGWIKARDAKQERFLAAYGNRPNAYFVPKTALNDISQLV